MNNQFIIKLISTFQDFDNLYLLLELLKGGDLRFHLDNYKYLITESHIKFLLTNIIFALDYINSIGIIHRDIKPENIIFDNNGYAKLTDFGIAKLNKSNIIEISGTVEYMSPECLFGKKQKYYSDFYSLGVICYECINRKKPFIGNKKEELKEQILNNRIHLKSNQYYSKSLCSFVNCLLKRNPYKRLGYLEGIKELEEHYLFNDMNWNDIYEQKEYSPWIEIINYSKEKFGFNDEIYDKEYCNRNIEIGLKTRMRYHELEDNLMSVNNQIFKGFTFLNKVNNNYNNDNIINNNYNNDNINNVINNQNLIENNKYENNIQNTIYESKNNKYQNDSDLVIQNNINQNVNNETQTDIYNFKKDYSRDISLEKIKNKEEFDEEKYENDFTTYNAILQNLEEGEEKNTIINLDDYKEIHESEQIQNKLNFFEDNNDDNLKKKNKIPLKQNSDINNSLKDSTLINDSYGDKIINALNNFRKIALDDSLIDKNKNN